MSRTKSSVLNMCIGSLLQIVSLLLSFASRTVFIQVLGNEYLSINGLFTNILTLLSFTELGVGSAIVYSLYKPLAEGDKEKIGKLINLFGKAYTYIAITITILGLLILPFLNYIISDVPTIKENLSLLYVLFLANTVLSYIWGYKKSLLTADQKQYVITIIYTALMVLQIVLQILILYITESFILYILVVLCTTVATNLISTSYVNKKYSWLKSYEHDSLDGEDKKNIYSNVKAILFYKIGATVLNGTDNIVISACLKTSLVGICSNYLMLVSAAQAVFRQGISGICASIGNYSVTASKKDNEAVFDQLNLLFFWCFGLVTLCLLVGLNLFVKIWIGDEYVLPQSIVIAFSFSFYYTMNNSIPYSYRTAMGVFKEARFAPLLAAIFNVLISIILAKTFGLIGVFIGTILTTVIFYCFVDIYFVCKKMNSSKRKYFTQFFLRTFFVLGIYFLTVYLLDLFPINDTILGLILKLFIVILIFNVAFFALFWKTSAFQSLKYKAKNRIIK